MDNNFNNSNIFYFYWKLTSTHYVYTSLPKNLEYKIETFKIKYMRFPINV